MEPCEPPSTHSAQVRTSLSRHVRGPCVEYRNAWPSVRRLREISASRTAPVSLVRLGLDLPFDEAQQDTVLLQGSPARARCNKGEDRTGSCGSRRGGSSLGCRRHHGRQQAERGPGRASLLLADIDGEWTVEGSGSDGASAEQDSPSPSYRPASSEEVDIPRLPCPPAHVASCRFRGASRPVFV